MTSGITIDFGGRFYFAGYGEGGLYTERAISWSKSSNRSRHRLYERGKKEDTRWRTNLWFLILSFISWPWPPLDNHISLNVHHLFLSYMTMTFRNILSKTSGCLLEISNWHFFKDVFGLRLTYCLKATSLKEICHGQTTTTSKLYNICRNGSMSFPRNYTYHKMISFSSFRPHVCMIQMYPNLLKINSYI